VGLGLGFPLSHALLLLASKLPFSRLFYSRSAIQIQIKKTSRRRHPRPFFCNSNFNFSKVQGPSSSSALTSLTTTTDNRTWHVHLHFQNHKYKGKGKWRGLRRKFACCVFMLPEIKASGKWQVAGWLDWSLKCGEGTSTGLRSKLDAFPASHKTPAAILLATA
jgi:hypothetical protein